MAQFNFSRLPSCRSPGPCRGRFLSCQPCRVVATLMLAGLVITSVCFVSGCAGAARDVASEEDAAERTTARVSEPGRSAVSSPAAETEPLERETLWRTDYEQAISLATQQDRPVLLRFTADWCVPCRVMDQNVFPNQDVKAALAAHVVPLKLDIDQESNAEIARRYGIRGIPTLLLVDSQGNELDRGNFMSAEALVKFVRKS